jgi:hypothetical protein
LRLHARVKPEIIKKITVHFTSFLKKQPCKDRTLVQESQLFISFRFTIKARKNTAMTGKTTEVPTVGRKPAAPQLKEQNKEIICRHENKSDVDEIKP